MVQINGTYKHVRSDGLDEFFEKVGLNAVMRKAMNSGDPVMEVSRDDDEFTIKMKTHVKNTELSFTLGEEFEEDLPEGKGKTVASMLSDTALCLKSASTKGNTQRTYEFSDEQVVLTMEHLDLGVNAKRYFRRT